MSAKFDISDVLKLGLTKLDMYTNKPVDGLKFVANYENEINPYIKLHLKDAKKYNADAVYFRYFENRPPIPQIYIYEEQKDINHLHKELWSSCKVPMFFILSKIDIKIFNSMSKKDIYEQNIEPFEIIKIASEIQNKLKYFKAKMFDSGEFWNEEYHKIFSHKNSAYNSLLEKLESERKRLIEKSKLSPQLTNSLLIKSILLKYLEEKKVFELDYWSKFLKDAKSFRDVCECNSSLVNLFDALSNHFNGGIFKLTDDSKQEILNSDLTEFKYFLQPNIDNNKQLYFWDLYSFKDLPIELISNIYELFLTENEKKGVVYTPSILVDFMIDEMISLDDPSVNFKVIDPSCGSGIFLVGTFKRLVQRWMIANDLKIPSVKVLKSLIINNIFGVDEKEEAVEVAKFSLSLALCDILAPEIIWNELHFDDLSKTGIDLVIGNPPFMSDKIISKKIEEIENKNSKNRPKLPDDNLAYLFLEQSFKLLKEDALIAMVQPSGFLYNNKVEPFRKYLLKNFNLRQVIDFTGLNKLYNGSKKDNKSTVSVATSVICFENNNPKIDTSEVLHLTIRQTFESKEKLYFDLSYYDFHWINYNEAIENKYIWKCNLVGGNRVVDIINRLNQYTKFNDLLENKQKINNWIYSTGFILGNKKNPAPHLHNSLALQTSPSNALNENGIDWNKTYTIKEDSFYRPMVEGLFKSPLIVIRKTLNKNTMLIDYSEKNISFSDSFIGISSPLEDKDKLKDIVNKFKEFSREFIFYIVATSAKVGVDKATVLYKNDIDNLPYPESIEEIKLSTIEQYFANDTIDYMLDWINGKQNLPIFKNVVNKQLKEYQSIYCDLLNTIYDKYKPLKILQTEQFIIMLFYYKNIPDNYLLNNDNLDETDIESLINNKIGKNVNITRVFKYYDKDLIYIIKPKQYRYWLKSIAVKDADDTFADLVDMRY